MNVTHKSFLILLFEQQYSHKSTKFFILFTPDRENPTGRGLY